MATPNIIVMAGTADGRQIVGELSKLDISVTATVTTGFGSWLLSGLKGVEVCEGKLSSGDMVRLIEKMRARCLVDATHPYAREASVNAIGACEKAGIPYLRFERSEAGLVQENILLVNDFTEAAEQVARMEGNIFLATGSNNLDVFVKRIPDYKNRLFARVLPDSRVMQKCEQAGLTAGNIFAAKGPFSEAMNIEMLKHCGASVLVTKDSGEVGGTGDKLRAAQKLGITVVMVRRPDVNYPRKVDSIGGVVDFVKMCVEREN
ncbi:MAG: precorrin-6A reductase [Clostridiales bacterium]|jgi:precorrin-6x reductase|nr:precorrin-6A reductase [Eubacteriales bacterium]MDH7565732.1 precorrin-6A reductase [Clostridiales bacterium]